jgi:hypothetical protein
VRQIRDVKGEEGGRKYRSLRKTGRGGFSGGEGPGQVYGEKTTFKKCF